MKIAFDISSAVKPQPTGIANATLNLVEALSKIDRENDYRLCCRLSRFLKYRSHFPEIDAPNFRRKVFHEPLCFSFPGTIDIFHSGGTRIPRFEGPKLVATIHDISLVLTDEFAEPAYRARKLERYYDSARRATKIITVSNFCKKEIVEHLDVDEDRVEVVHHGVDPRFRPVREGLDSLRARYGLERDYILYVGMLMKKKNPEGIFRSLRILLDSTRQPVQLALAGRHRKEKWLPILRELGLEDDVRFLGYVPAEDLPGLYSGAMTLLFPSLYEGFGLPVVEAMACACPVITSNRAALPEVAGDAAIIVDPLDSAEMAAGLERLLDPEERERLRERGLKRAKDFTWENAARKVLDLYGRLMS